jgi:hypothetical protein
VELPALRRLLRLVADTRDDEISCDECFDLVAQYVDREAAEERAAPRLLQLEHHLDQCGVCREEYEVLRDFARLERNGEAPSVDELRRLL